MLHAHSEFCSYLHEPSGTIHDVVRIYYMYFIGICTRYCVIVYFNVLLSILWLCDCMKACTCNWACKGIAGT
jgi:hypothetical protein